MKLAEPVLSSSQTLAFSGSVWREPLVPVALAATVGMLLDRFAAVPLSISLVVVLAGAAAWILHQRAGQQGLALFYLGLAVVGFGASWHHWRLRLRGPSDIGFLATPEPTPIRVRCTLDESPRVFPADRDAQLRSRGRSDRSISVLRLTAIRSGEHWLPVTGRALLHTEGFPDSVSLGDEIELTGVLSPPASPANQGEFDQAAHLADRNIHAIIEVRKSTGSIVRTKRASPLSPRLWLAAVHDRASAIIRNSLNAPQQDVGVALLLGENGVTDLESWLKYSRTGVVHVLAISGQHLAILSGVLWFAVRLSAVRRRQAALVVALFLVGYTLLTGARPPIVRAATVVVVHCLGLMLGRQPLLANSLALSWLVVAFTDPADIFNTGCQLSFLAVIVLFWGAGRFTAVDTDPLARLVEESLPIWRQLLLRVFRLTLECYLVSAGVVLAVSPLILARSNLLSPVAILIGPPVVVLTNIALVLGFLLLLTSWFYPLRFILGWAMDSCLWGANTIVDWAEKIPGGHAYLPAVPDWWLCGFYLGLLAYLTVAALRRRGRLLFLVGMVWLVGGLLVGLFRFSPQEFRCTFLAVGHGGCTVMETPDGRVLLYDAGAMAGPEVTRRHIAPFLWSRGIRRVDEVFLSHADLDHFNGLPALLDRFAVGQITCTPTFKEKAEPSVSFVLAGIAGKKVPYRQVSAGASLRAGDVTLEVLHPPADRIPGTENTRSLVLLVRHRSLLMLLTGDLEGAGLDRLLAMPSMEYDVLMAPHHGSPYSNTKELAQWARPRVVVSCDGRRRSSRQSVDAYLAENAHYLSTWTHGAVTVRLDGTDIIIETFKTGRRIVISKPEPVVVPAG